MVSSVKSPETLYSGDFHTDRDLLTRSAAHNILGKLREWVQAESICDVGCGVGSWLAAASDLGFTVCRGIEGPWGRNAELVVDPSIVTFQDLTKSFVGDSRYDLVITLEVAEHLPEPRAAGFVEDLCELGDLVLFSAAIPMQGGKGHVNERWPSFWAQHFERQHFDPFDPIRPLFWTDRNIPFWYRQNTLLYARKGSSSQKALTARGFCAPAIFDLVHPEQYEFAESAQPRRALGRAIKGALGIT